MKVQDIQINHLYFQFMSKEEPRKTERVGSTSELDEKVHKIYAGYVSKIANQTPSRNAYDIFEISEDYKLKTKPSLEKLNHMNIPDDEANFNLLSKSLAEKYIEIDKSPISGVFFIVLFTFDGRRFVSILKLDWVTESWTKFDEETSKMTLHEVLKELPGDDRFRKGAIFPHPSEPNKKYMMVYQKDNPADFFDDFLAGRQRTTAYDVMTAMRSITRKISGDWPSIEEQMGLYDGLEATVKKGKKSIDKITITDIMKSSIPSHASKVKETVESDWVLRGELDPSEVDDLFMEFMVEGIKLRGPICEFRKRFVFNVGGNPEKHRITGRTHQVRHLKK